MTDLSQLSYLSSRIEAKRFLLRLFHEHLHACRLIMKYTEFLFACLAPQHPVDTDPTNGVAKIHLTRGQPNGYEWA